jgi:CspA family cold shock protein
MSTNDIIHKSLIGRVKWFNTRAGYGFITAQEGCSETAQGTDVFVHHSGIGELESNEAYKYLVQGEYVEFDLQKCSSGSHEFQATNVVGIKGGKLMCQTRSELKESRTQYRVAKRTEEKKEWIVVDKSSRKSVEPKVKTTKPVEPKVKETKVKEPKAKKTKVQ